MKIHKAKASNYDSVDSKWIADYIQEYAYAIHNKVNNTMTKDGGIQANERLIKANRTQLKAIAVDLETALKRLEWILEGKY